jgi:hypothetical protein
MSVCEPTGPPPQRSPFSTPSRRRSVDLVAGLDRYANAAGAALLFQEGLTHAIYFSSQKRTGENRSDASGPSTRRLLSSE